MRKVLHIMVAILSCSLVAAETAPAPAGGEGMPLPVYQKIKAHFDGLYGAKTALLPGLAPVNRADMEKALRTDAEANKDVLVKALDSNSVIHRELAARALEYCGDKKLAVGTLSKAVVSDSDENVRRAAATALAKLPDAAAVDALVKALGDSADSVRGVSATALGNIKDARAAEPLLRLLADDAKPMVRMQAATALSKIKEPTTLEPLKKALETEKDERVKMAIAGAMRNLMNGDNAQTEQVPTAQDAANELASLSKEMKEVEEKLRADRHDQAVQVQGGGIENKLAQLIEKLEKAGGGGGGGSQKGEKDGQKQQQQSGGQANGGKSGGSPLNDSKLGGAVPPGAMNAAQVAGKQDAWAKLPPAQRDELLQAFREEMPERWRKRLEAYFLSVAAEETKSTDK